MYVVIISWPHNLYKTKVYGPFNTRAEADRLRYNPKLRWEVLHCPPGTILVKKIRKEPKKYKEEQ